jgi:hypothetical protein
MNSKYIFLIFLFCNSVFAQYYNNPIKVQVEVIKPPISFSEAWNKSLNEATERNYKNSIIRSENRRIELEEESQAFLFAEQKRLNELQSKQVEYQKKINEENDPNSILNKAKNNKLKLENQELKNRLIQIELLLSEKEKNEKEALEKLKLKKNSKTTK